MEVRRCPPPASKQSAWRVDGPLKDTFSQVLVNPDPIARVLMERMSGKNIEEDFMMLNSTY